MPERRRLRRPRLEVGIDCRDPAALAPFWRTALGYEVAEAEGDRYVNLAPADGDGPVVFLQRVPEPKAGKNRVHVDLYTGDPLALVTLLLDAGAAALGEPHRDEDGEWSFQVMADPEGNEFCVCAEAGAVPPPEDYR